MPKLKAMSTYTAGRKITINGTTYQPGASIPVAVLRPIKHLGALLSRRTVIPDVDPNNRKGRLRTPTPTSFGSIFRKTV